MDALDRLVAIEEIKQLKARYFRSIDTKEFDLLRTVFAPDAVFDFRQALRDPVSGNPEGAEETAPVEGLENIVKAVSEALEVAQSAHHGHVPEIEILSDTKARGIWPMEDVVLNRGFAFRGYGHYRETYERIDSEWRIKTSQITRLRIVVEQTAD